MLFSNLTLLNKAALILFLSAKIFGFVGVCLGFAGSEYMFAGSVFLFAAFFSIFSSIVCGLLQTSRDKKNFEKEDKEFNKLKRLKLERMLIEKEIEDLKFRKESLTNLAIRRS